MVELQWPFVAGSGLVLIAQPRQECQPVDVGSLDNAATSFLLTTMLYEMLNWSHIYELR